MKKLNFILAILTLSGLILTGFTFEKSENYSLSFTANSPLDLSGLIIKTEETEVKKDAGNPESSDWYSEAVSNIQKAEYNVSFSDKLNAFQSPNRANNMRFVYQKNGFTAMLRNNKVALFDESDKTIEEKNKKYDYLDEWKVNFKIENVSKELNSNTENYFTDFDGNEFSTNNNLISIENENLRIQYLNDEKGMRQDFIVKNKPEGNNKLKLKMKTETDLNMVVGADALMFTEKKGVQKMKYSSLKVWDANGVELRAYFEKPPCRFATSRLSQRGDRENYVTGGFENSKSYTIVVNDEDAVYPITIDPLSYTPAWTAEINQASANFGWSVATAGDVNGDGYSDVIISAPKYDNGQNDEGGVFMYYGSMGGLALSPSWIKEINKSDAKFGFSVATAGDINGDGYSDVIIGAPSYENGQANEGRAYVFNGSATGLQTSNSWKYETNQAGENFGFSVACAGDIDNDGYSDVLIGSPFYDGGQSNEGKIYLFKGSSAGLNLVTADWTYESNQSLAQLGISVATAGDVNGDGYSDVIAGANSYDNGFIINAGRIFVFNSLHGTLPSTPSSTRDGIQANENFGLSVSTAGDVNSDGYSDVIIGAPFYDEIQTDIGKCYAYHGSATGIGVSPAWTKLSGHSGTQFGISVSTAGDMNGDGYADVIVGGNYIENGDIDEGCAFVYLGNSGGLNNSPEVIYQKDQVNASFGYSVATAGDINGDGYSDVIVGAFNFDNPGNNEGMAFVYLGYAIGLSKTSSWSIEETQREAKFGYSVSSAGDVNGDGYSDVIVGSCFYDNGQGNEGAAFVYHGSASGLSAFSNWSAEGNQSSANFGKSVSTAGDVNGDGYSDVIVGALLYDNGQGNEGAAFVYHGSASGLNLTSDWSAESNQADANFGISVSSAGDVNGDGFSDVIVGAYLNDNGQSNEGRSFVYHGSAGGLSSISNWSAECNQADAYFGYSVSSAGDVNGDGFSDVIVGAYLYNNGQSNEGRSYVYHGSASGLSATTNWNAESNQTDSKFGISVSSAGDVNGDGYSDVIVGASEYIDANSYIGAVFVYHGSASGLSASLSWTEASHVTVTSFGRSVSSAGDVNGDGYSDVIVGASVYIDEPTARSGAFVYYGTAYGLTNYFSRWSVVDNQPGSTLGSSVSSAGDVNGDGFSDVIVGDEFHGFDEKGAAYVYYGGNKDGLRSTVQQCKYGTSQVVSSNGNTGEVGKVRLKHFAKSPFGKGEGRIVYDIKENGTPFDGSIIKNSTSFNGTPSTYTNLGLNGKNISQDMTGFNPDYQYKWRARVQYEMTSFPFQKFGPWRYHSNYIPMPAGGFRAKEINLNLTLNLTAFIEGFYRSGTDDMISDTLSVYLRNSSAPFDIVDSAKALVSESGLWTFNFSNAANEIYYYLQLRHRNSIETWSKIANKFTSDVLDYNFSTAINMAYGDNQKLVDSSPGKYGIFSGDVNQDGTINLNDVVQTYNAANVFSSGYTVTDVTGNNLTDLSDVLLTYNNSSQFVSKITP